MADNNNYAKILIPMIRKVLPGLIAQDIVGVQPMSMPSKLLTYEVLDTEWQTMCPRGHTAIMTNIEIGHWVEQQPVHMWKFIDLEKDGKTFHATTHFFVSDQLLTWLRMKWE